MMTNSPVFRGLGKAVAGEVVEIVLERSLEGVVTAGRGGLDFAAGRDLKVATTVEERGTITPLLI